MLERIQADASAAKVAQVTGVNNRVDIAVAPAPTAAEAPDAAVAPVSETYATTTDADVARQIGQAIGQMRNETNSIADAEAAQKELEEIYAKIFKHQQAQSTGETQAADGEIDAVIARLDKVEIAIIGSRRKDETPPIKPLGSSVEEAPVDGVEYERGSVMNKIESALQRVGSLRVKLSGDSASGYDRLLNITASVSGLKAARAQVDESRFSVESATRAYDSIMNNLRSVVVAHGKVSPDIVRLILN
jgi:hypothetical protein